MKKFVLLAVLGLLILSVSACYAGGWKVQLWMTGADGEVVSREFSGFHPDGLVTYDLGAVDFGIHGVVSDLMLELDADPVVGLHFSYISGISPVQDFKGKAWMDIVPTLNVTNVVASGGVTLTEGADTLPNATVTGNYPGGKIWRATYNSTVNYADLVTGWSLLNDTETNSEISKNPILVPVNRIGIEFDFSLTDGDLASGTGRFFIAGEPVPEPSSILAMVGGGIGMLGFALRKRRS